MDKELTHWIDEQLNPLRHQGKSIKLFSQDGNHTGVFSQRSGFVTVYECDGHWAILDDDNIGRYGVYHYRDEIKLAVHRLVWAIKAGIPVFQFPVAQNGTFATGKVYSVKDLPGVQFTAVKVTPKTVTLNNDKGYTVTRRIRWTNNGLEYIQPYDNRKMYGERVDWIVTALNIG